MKDVKCSKLDTVGLENSLKKMSFMAGYRAQRDGCVKLMCEACTDVDNDNVLRCDHEICELSSQLLEIKEPTGQVPRRAIYTDTEIANNEREVWAGCPSLK